MKRSERLIEIKNPVARIRFLAKESAKKSGKALVKIIYRQQDTRQLIFLVNRVEKIVNSAAECVGEFSVDF
jgi:hypothetical protein